MEEGKFSIQPVSEGTFNDFFRFQVEMAEFEKMAPPDRNAKTRLYTDLFQTNPSSLLEAYIGFMNSIPQGFLHVSNGYSTFNARPTLKIEDIYVTEDARGTGLAKFLMDSAVDLAKDRNCCRVELDVLKWNSGARRFYEKSGFEEKGEWVSYDLGI